MINGDVYLYEYNSGDGTVVVDRVRDDLQGVEEMYRGQYMKSMSTVEPFYLAADEVSTLFFAYDDALKPGDLNVEVLVYRDVGSMQVGIVWQGKWSSNWTIIKPFYFPPTPFPPIQP
jgi:hypothetical protein